MDQKLKMKEFCNLIWTYYKNNERTFVWRENITPYTIFVSEVMLQQTQTSRVAQKFSPFIEFFPSFNALAHASQADVLRFWQGLGYNRRALGLHKSAQIIVGEYDGNMPNDPELLVKLPGIGPATAASICAFAFNRPTVFIETNIRAVFLHHFFKDQGAISDKQLLPLVQAALDENNENARHWYYALMDYGVMLKKNLPNPSRKSKHHTTQSKFEGSDRQIRGKILKYLTSCKSATFNELFSFCTQEEERFVSILSDLCKEGFVKSSSQKYFL